MSDESHDMHVSRPAFRYEVNLTTVIALVMAMASFGGWFWSDGQKTQRYDSWIGNHEILHKDRLAIVSANEARTDQRLGALELATRRVDNIEYRLTVQEQGSANLAKAVDELKNTVNSLGTDIRVIREIVERTPRP